MWGEWSGGEGGGFPFPRDAGQARHSGLPYLKVPHCVEDVAHRVGRERTEKLLLVTYVKSGSCSFSGAVQLGGGGTEWKAPKGRYSVLPLVEMYRRISVS